MTEGKIAPIGFRVSEQLARDFKSMCAARGTTIQSVLTRAMEEYLARERENEKPE